MSSSWIHLVMDWVLLTTSDPPGRGWVVCLATCTVLYCAVVVPGYLRGKDLLVHSGVPVVPLEGVEQTVGRRAAHHNWAVWNSPFKKSLSSLVSFTPTTVPDIWHSNDWPVIPVQHIEHALHDQPAPKPGLEPPSPSTSTQAMQESLRSTFTQLWVLVALLPTWV